MAKRLAKQLYAKIESDHDSTWYSANPDLSVIMQQVGDKAKVGVYKLIEVIGAEAVVQTHKTHEPR
jgi:hypothetical protein